MGTLSSQHLSAKQEADFPNLNRDEYHITSSPTDQYNCIAHAAGRDDNWWWPADFDWVYWPDDVPKEATVEAFVKAYATLGYEVCDNGELEEGCEKVAIFVEDDGTTPSHAARQLPSGCWTSKLGRWEDIEHATLRSMERGDSGAAYGSVSTFLKRAVTREPDVK